jgi:RNA polymerase sigma-70 factor (ECF subfamily)
MSNYHGFGVDPDSDPATAELTEECAEETQHATQVVGSNWALLVEGIRRGDDTAMEELYSSFSHGIRYYFCKHLGAADLDDRVHNAYLAVVQSVRNGTLREPEALMGYVKTVIRRQVAAGIDEAIHARKERMEFEAGAYIADDRQTPEEAAIRRQNAQLMVKVLREVSPRDREILCRFYLHGHTPEHICQEMGLTDTQFRLLKSRAKARFGQLGRRFLSANHDIK